MINQSQHGKAASEFMTALLQLDLGLRMDDLMLLIDGDDLKLEFNLLAGRVSVSIGGYWQYPGMTCYFVNARNDKGDFCACPGTPFLARAIFDLGGAVRSILQPAPVDAGAKQTSGY